MGLQGKGMEWVPEGWDEDILLCESPNSLVSHGQQNLLLARGKQHNL